MTASDCLAAGAVVLREARAEALLPVVQGLLSDLPSLHTPWIGSEPRYCYCYCWLLLGRQLQQAMLAVNDSGTALLSAALTHLLLAETGPTERLVGSTAQRLGGAPSRTRAGP